MEVTSIWQVHFHMENTAFLKGSILLAPNTGALSDSALASGSCEKKKA